MSLFGAMISAAGRLETLGVVPIMVGPMAALLAALPAIALALVGLLVTLFKPSTMKRLIAMVWAQKVAMIIIVVAIGGLVYGYRVLAGNQRGGGAQGTARGDGTWTMYRGSPDRRAWRPDGDKGVRYEDPAHGNVNWSFSQGDIKEFYASPAVVGNRIYAIGSCYSFTKNLGVIYCLDADSGKVIWVYGDDFRATFSSPVVSRDGKYLVCGEGLHLTKNARIFCLDISDAEKTGKAKLAWSYRTKSHVESSPCIWEDTATEKAAETAGKGDTKTAAAKGAATQAAPLRPARMIIGAGEDGLYCFALQPKPDGSPDLLWHRDGNDLTDCESSPMVYEGDLYFGLGRGLRALEDPAYATRQLRGVACLDVDSGKTLWEFNTPCPTDSPAIAEGMLYMAGGWGDFVNDGPTVRSDLAVKLKTMKKSDAEIKAATDQITDGGHVWCIDLKTHKQVWKCDDMQQTVLGTPAVDGGLVYIGSRDRFLYCLDAKSGDVVRKFDAHSPILSSPAVGDKYLYFTTSTGTLYCLNKTTLAPVWVVGLNQQIFSSPAITKGHLYFGTNGAGLMQVGQPGLEKLPPVWAGDLGGPGKAGTVDGSLIPVSGTFAWGFTGASEDDSGDAGTPWQIQSPAAFVAGDAKQKRPPVFYVGVSSKDSHDVTALAGNDDLGQKPARKWLATTTNAVSLSPAATTDEVFFVDGRPGDKGRKLRCVDSADGHVRWNSDVESDAPGDFMIQGKALFVADKAGGVSRFEIGDSKGPVERKATWSSQTGPCVGTPSAAGDFVAVAVSSPPHLAVLDSVGGETLWQQPLTSAPRSGAVLLGERVWVALADGIHGFSLLKSNPLQVQCDPRQGRLIWDGSEVACMTESGGVIVANADTGKVLAKASDVNGSVPPILASDSLLYYSKDSLETLDVRSGKSIPWAKVAPTWPGTIVTPMIMVDSHVFFGTDKRGLICYKPKKG